MSSITMPADSTQSDIRIDVVGHSKPKRKRRKDGNDKRRKKGKGKKSGPGDDSTKRRFRGDSDSDCDSDLDLSKELKPISAYLRDREDTIDHLFRSISNKKMRAMLPEILKSIPVDELRKLCLEQLECMSQKRIRRILQGADPETISSSGTDDEDQASDYQRPHGGSSGDEAKSDGEDVHSPGAQSGAEGEENLEVEGETVQSERSMSPDQSQQGWSRSRSRSYSRSSQGSRERRSSWGSSPGYRSDGGSPAQRDLSSGGEWSRSDDSETEEEIVEEVVVEEIYLDEGDDLEEVLRSKALGHENVAEIIRDDQGTDGAGQGAEGARQDTVGASQDTKEASQGTKEASPGTEAEQQKASEEASTEQQAESQETVADPASEGQQAASPKPAAEDQQGSADPTAESKSDAEPTVDDAQDTKSESLKDEDGAELEKAGSAEVDVKASDDHKEEAAAESAKETAAEGDGKDGIDDKFQKVKMISNTNFSETDKNVQETSTEAVIGDEAGQEHEEKVEKDNSVEAQDAKQDKVVDKMNIEEAPTPAGDAEASVASPFGLEGNADELEEGEIADSSSEDEGPPLTVEEESQDSLSQVRDFPKTTRRKTKKKRTVKVVKRIIKVIRRKPADLEKDGEKRVLEEKQQENVTKKAKSDVVVKKSEEKSKVSKGRTSEEKALNKMAILELEMRARAIKAMLRKQEDHDHGEKKPAKQPESRRVMVSAHSKGKTRKVLAHKEPGKQDSRKVVRKEPADDKEDPDLGTEQGQAKAKRIKLKRN